ncbi:MAG TPA: sodium:solute symporter, partial [Armatimonadota bacterium]|nr:sodium:solute symporter [Armatimonadota bacterium]
PTVIVNLMVISWGVLVGAFLAPYVYGLFWKRTTKAGAIVGLLAGVGTSVGFYCWLGAPGIPLGGAVSIIIPVILVPVVSLFTQPLPQKHLDRAFGENALPE